MKNNMKKSAVILFIISVFISIQVSGMIPLVHNTKSSAVETHVEFYQINNEQIRLLKLEKERYKYTLLQIKSEHQSNVDKILRL